MPVSPDFVTRVSRQLSEARPIRIKKMFGGLGIYLDEAFFGVCDDDGTFFKVDESNLKRYEEAGMGPWMMGGVLNDKYRQVPEAVMDEPGELGEWIDAAAEVARRKKGK